MGKGVINLNWFIITKNFIIFAIISYIIFMIVKSMMVGENKNIENKVKELGGTVLSIEKNKSYLKEVDKIEKKKRFFVSEIYKIKYILDSKEKVMYLVIYKDFVMLGRESWYRDWIEKPE